MLLNKSGNSIQLSRKIAQFIIIVFGLIALLGSIGLISASFSNHSMGHISSNYLDLLSSVRKLNKKSFLVSMKYIKITSESLESPLELLDEIRSDEKALSKIIKLLFQKIVLLEDDMDPSTISIKHNLTELSKTLQKLSKRNEEHSIAVVSEDYNLAKVQAVRLSKTKQIFQQKVFEISGKINKLVENEIIAVKNMMTNIYYATIIIIILSIITVFFITRKLIVDSKEIILSPIEDFQKMSKELSKGNFKGVIDEESAGDMKDFAVEFNNMKTKLFDYQQRIESYKKALDQIALVGVMDSDGHFLEANENYVRTSGYSIDDLIKQKHKWCFNCQHEETSKSMLKALDAGLPWKGEMLHIGLDGSEYWTDTAIVPIFSAKDFGVIDKRIAISFDITEEKKNQQRLKEQEAQLMLSSKLTSLGEMASGIAHEVNNPLVIINTTSSVISKLLKKEPINIEKINKFMKEIQEMVMRISKIISGLKALSHNEQDNTPDSNLHDIFENLAAVYMAKFKEHEIKYTLENPDIIPATLFVRQGEISQILITLINNSIDALAKLEGEKWIKVFPTLKEKALEIRFVDCGKGIASDALDKIFDPFYTTKEIGSTVGAGLGLSVARTTIERSGGSLKYDTESENTCFIVTIPNV